MTYLYDGRWLVTVPKRVSGKSMHLASFGTQEAAAAAAAKYYPRIQMARAGGRPLEEMFAARAEIIAEVSRVPNELLGEEESAHTYMHCFGGQWRSSNWCSDSQWGCAMCERHHGSNPRPSRSGLVKRTSRYKIFWTLCALSF